MQFVVRFQCFLSDQKADVINSDTVSIFVGKYLFIFGKDLKVLQSVCQTENYKGFFHLFFSQIFFLTLFKCVMRSIVILFLRLFEDM